MYQSVFLSLDRISAVNVFRSLITCKNNVDVTILCGRWSRLAGGRSLQVRDNLCLGLRSPKTGSRPKEIAQDRFNCKCYSSYTVGPALVEN